MLCRSLKAGAELFTRAWNGYARALANFAYMCTARSVGNR